jgi:HlyD family secretion protein
MPVQIPLIGKVERVTPWIVGIVLAGAIGTVGAASYFIVQANKPKFDVAELTVPVEPKTLTVQVEASGAITPIESVNLSPKAAGRLEEVYVNQGDRVTAGQVIARMEGDDVDASLAQARAGLLRAEGRLAELQAGNRTEEVAQAKANADRAKAAVAQARTTVAQAEAGVQEASSRLKLAQERIARNQSLLAEGAISRDRWDELDNAAQTAQSALNSAKANLGNSRANLNVTEAAYQEALQRFELAKAGTRREQILQAQAQVAEAKAGVQAVEVRVRDVLLRSPFTGVVTQRYADPGDFVTPTTSASSTASATSTSIVALAKGLEILAKVPEVDIGQIKLGQAVEIRADAYPEEVFKGAVRLIAPEAVVEQNVTYFQVKVTLQTGQSKLKSGMNTDVTFLGTQLKDALSIPIVAIVTEKGESGVLIPGKDNQPKFQPITIGATVGNQVQVLEGLESGQRIFVELPEGKKLEDFTQPNGANSGSGRPRIPR